MKIVFSIPIHERLDVAIDQILNFSYYNKDSIIIIHISEGFKFEGSLITEGEFFKIINLMDNVYINSNRLRSGYCDIIQCHISNFNFIKDKVDFDYFCMSASNSMFIKSGLEKYISLYDAGHSYCIESESVNWIQMTYARQDSMLLELMKKEYIYNIVGTQIEGCFYKRNIFNQIQQVINKYFDYTKINLLYAREEIYFSTVANKFLRYDRLLTNPYTYMDWSNNLEISIDKINEIRAYSEFYEVKRVKRDIKDCVRQYLASEIGSKYLLLKYDETNTIAGRFYGN